MGLFRAKKHPQNPPFENLNLKAIYNNLHSCPILVLGVHVGILRGKIPRSHFLNNFNRHTERKSASKAFAPSPSPPPTKKMLLRNVGVDKPKDPFVQSTVTCNKIAFQVIPRRLLFSLSANCM